MVHHTPLGGAEMVDLIVSITRLIRRDADQLYEAAQTLAHLDRSVTCRDDAAVSYLQTRFHALVEGSILIRGEYDHIKSLTLSKA